jgi:hypothetical protein
MNRRKDVMNEKITRVLGVVAAVAALALGGAAIAAATGGSGGGSAGNTPALDNHADGETNDDGAANVDNHADGETNDDHGVTAKPDGSERGDSAHDADGSAQAEASE